MSTLKYDTWQNYAGTATFYGATAWVCFNGTGTVAIRDSKNVSSITDNGTGDYTVNFATAMLNSNYTVGGANGSGAVASTPTVARPGTVTTTAHRFTSLFATGSSVGAYDPDYCYMTFFGGVE